MLIDWPVKKQDKRLKLFIINERWGIRNNSFDNWAAVIVHRCKTGQLGHVHDLKRNNNKCDQCHTIVPDGVQALWLLRTCSDHDKMWMKGGCDDKS